MNKARIIARSHLSLAIVWGLLLIPTLVWWKNSVLWVAFCIIYNIILGHIEGHGTAKAQEKIDE